MLTEVCIVKDKVFPVVMYGCESWNIKKAEHQRIDAFKLWCWRRLFRVTWTARRSNRSILKEISPECSLEGLMLNLKLQYCGHLMRRADFLKKTLMLEKIEGKRRTGWQDEMVGWDQLFQWTWVWANFGDGEGLVSLVCCSSWDHKESDRTEQQFHNSFSSVQFAQSCPTLCDPMCHSTPGLPVQYKLQEFTQTQVHWVSDAIQPIRALLSPSPPAFNLSQHQGLFQRVSSSHKVAQVLEFQLQHQSYQRIFTTDLL